MGRSTVLLITSTGLVGGNILAVTDRRRWDVVETYYPAVDKPHGSPVDISDAAAVDMLVRTVRPSVVILSAALTNVEFCQDNRDIAWKINVQGPENTARACASYGARLVFFSSDYVFDGSNGPYSETDRPNPISVYGETKLAAETAIQKALADHLIIRTTIVYGYEAQAKNFCYRLINTVRSGAQIKVPVDQIGSPTYARNLARVVIDLVEHGRTGLYNVVGREYANRYEFARRVCAVFGLDERLVVPVTTDTLGQKAPRPLNAGLRIDKVQRDCAVPVMGIDESLREFKKEIDEAIAQ